jgi:hypothetical protein
MTVGTRRHCKGASPKQSMFSVIPAQAGISCFPDFLRHFLLFDVNNSHYQ